MTAGGQVLVSAGFSPLFRNRDGAPCHWLMYLITVLLEMLHERSWHGAAHTDQIFTGRPPLKQTETDRPSRSLRLRSIPSPGIKIVAKEVIGCPAAPSGLRRTALHATETILLFSTVPVETGVHKGMSVRGRLRREPRAGYVSITTQCSDREKRPSSICRLGVQPSACSVLA